MLPWADVILNSTQLLEQLLPDWIALSPVLEVYGHACKATNECRTVQGPCVVAVHGNRANAIRKMQAHACWLSEARCCGTSVWQGLQHSVGGPLRNAPRSTPPRTACAAIYMVQPEVVEISRRAAGSPLPVCGCFGHVLNPEQDQHRLLYPRQDARCACMAR